MIRVAANRCGYSGYTCVGIPSLTPAFECLYGLVCDPHVFSECSVEQVENCEYSDSDICYYGVNSDQGLDENSDSFDLTNSETLEKFDNFYNLPGKARGMVMSLDYILDMDRVKAPVPEKECYKDLSGYFVDMYGKVFADLATVSATTDPDDPEYAPIKDGYPCFELNDTVMDPGILEPMLNTNFSPVGIDVLPGWETGIDGLMVSIIGIMKWRIRIDGIFTSIMNQITGIEGILNELFQSSSCTNFGIYTNGKAFARGSGTRTFRVRAGTARINGKSYSTGGKSIGNLDSKGSLNVYLKVAFPGGGDNGELGEPTISISTSKSGASNSVVYIGLGSVEAVQFGGTNGIPKYTAWRITQERCEIDTDIVRTSRGGILTINWSAGGGGGGGGGSGNSYGAAEAGDCDE